MATKERFDLEEINPENHIFSKLRITVETAFYRNNVVNVNTRREAYKLAKNSPGTITLSWKVRNPDLLDLDDDTHVLLFNDGAITGRYAPGRRIIGHPNVDEDFYVSLVREAVYQARYRKLYHAISYTGLHEDFMVKNHILIPEGHENLLYNWLLNFQHDTPKYRMMYERSEVYDEGDVYIFSDPDWKHPDFPMGLAIFDPEHNAAAILGMRYFGEFKKGTLTLGWGIANRNGFVSCHGGLKRFELPSGEKVVTAFFGLSGSGKSTLTHAKHSGKYSITILHDDAFIINLRDGSSIALEPQYFDKTADYPVTSPDNEHLITIQNCGVTITKSGELVPVMEDMRNGNGRAIKSRFWSPNRVDKISDPINAIFWIMKDPVLPPIVKVTDPVLASTMGATLATKRTSAEVGVNTGKLVFEPYANPFRTWRLSEDFEKFKELFENGVDCYILNTGYFMGRKVPKELTLSLVEGIVENTLAFKSWIHGLMITDIDGFNPDMEDRNYTENARKSFTNRLEYVKSLAGDVDELPEEALESLEEVLKSLKLMKFV